MRSSLKLFEHWSSDNVHLCKQWICWRRLYVSLSSVLSLGNAACGLVSFRHKHHVWWRFGSTNGKQMLKHHLKQRSLAPSIIQTTSWYLSQLMSDVQLCNFIPSQETFLSLSTVFGLQRAKWSGISVLGELVLSSQSRLENVQWLAKSDHSSRLRFKIFIYWSYWMTSMRNMSMSAGVSMTPLDIFKETSRTFPAELTVFQLIRFPWSACWSVLGQDTEPQTAPDVLVGTLHGSHRHQCMNVCMNKSPWTKSLW